MKDILKPAAAFTALTVLIPLAALNSQNSQTSADEPIINNTVHISETKLSETQITITPTTEPTVLKAELAETLKILITATDDVITLDMTDYIIGAVFAEMPASFHAEALKAQAVAAHTYAVRQKEKQTLNPDETLKGADISDDFTKYQAFMTLARAEEIYGDEYGEVYEKISNAVEDVADKLLVYRGEPIIAAFHSISSGRTEGADVIWGAEVEYLVPVESEYDKDVAKYEETLTFTPAELKARLNSEYGSTFSADKSAWFAISERSDSGTVTKLLAGDKTITGVEFRTTLTLRSANFTIVYDKDKDVFEVVTKGYGHGVGMSQHGANAMAQNGFTYDEILFHYYSGADIISNS